MEPTTFDPQGRTLISIVLMLAAEQLRRPTLTLAKLSVDLSFLSKRVELPRPKEWYAPGDSDTLTTYSPVPICATMTLDGVDVKFEACEVVDVFPPGICLGPKELKCYKISRQESIGEARIDERGSLVVSFVVPQAAPIPLRGLVDTGSNLDILCLQPSCRSDRCNVKALPDWLIYRQRRNYQNVQDGRTRALPAGRLSARKKLSSGGRRFGSRGLPAGPQLPPSLPSAR